MKRLALVGVLLSMPNLVFAIHPAAKRDADRIQAYIDDAHLSARRLPLLDRQLQEKIAKYGEGSEAVQKARARRDSEARKLDADRNKAIHLTLIAFGIVKVDAQGHPEAVEGTAVTNDPSKGRAIQWVVVFGENVPRATQGAKGEPEVVGPAKEDHGRPPAALTATDGVTVVFPTALTSPKDLAVYLFHEKRHFEQYTTKGLGDVMIQPETEVDAWRVTKAAIRSVGFSQAEQKARLEVADGYVLSNERRAKRQRAVEALTYPLILPASRLPAPNTADQRKRLRHEQAQTIAALEQDEKLPDFRLPTDQLAAIRDDEDALRRRIEHEDSVMQGIDFDRDGRPPTQPAPLPTVPVIDFPTAPSEALDMARRICGGATVSQDDLDQAIGRLRVNLRDHGFAVPFACSCETKVFSEMAGAADQKRSLSAAWANSMTRHSYCQSAAAEGNAVYRETVRAAETACHAPGGITEEALSDLVGRSFKNTDSAVPLSQLDTCENDIYFMLCEGDARGEDWSASDVNARVRAIAAGQSHGSGSNGGGYASEPSSRGGDRTERSGNLDLSRPINYVRGLTGMHPHFD